MDLQAFVVTINTQLMDKSRSFEFIINGSFLLNVCIDKLLSFNVYLLLFTLERFLCYLHMFPQASISKSNVEAFYVCLDI